MKKTLISLFCIFSLTACSYFMKEENEEEQPGTICGFVYDIESYDKVIRNAQVTLSPGDAECRTDSDGYFEFGNLAAGKYKLTADADGYNDVYRQLTVGNNEEIICDFPLRSIDNSYAEVSPASGLDFGRGSESLSVELKAHNAALSYHAELEGNPAWVSLEKKDGTIPNYEKTSEVEYLKLTVDRANMSRDVESCTLVIRSGQKDFRIKVSARKGSEGDYSSAVVTSCDSRIKVKIVNCIWSGSSVVFNYTLTNVGLGDVGNFYIYFPSRRDRVTTIYDNKGNEYMSASMIFRDDDDGYNGYIYSKFPEGPECKASVVIYDVPSDVKFITYILDVSMSSYSCSPLTGNKITFRNVPVYK